MTSSSHCFLVEWNQGRLRNVQIEVCAKHIVKEEFDRLPLTRKLQRNKPLAAFLCGKMRVNNRRLVTS